VIWNYSWNPGPFIEANPEQRDVCTQNLPQRMVVFREEFLVTLSSGMMKNNCQEFYGFDKLPSFNLIPNSIAIIPCSTTSLAADPQRNDNRWNQ